MAANVGSAYFSLRASTDQLGNDISRGMRLAQQRLKAAAVGIGRVVATSLAVGVGALSTAVAQTATKIDLLAKESRKLGIATEELQLLRHAAALTGVESQKLGTGLQRMTRRVAEAAVGTGEAVNALRELNLNAEKLNQLSPDKVFIAVGEAMQGVSNQSDRIRLAMKLFDSEGVGLVNTLQLTKSELDAMRTELEQMGVTVSKEGAARIEHMNDSFQVLQASMSGALNQITVAFAPALSAVAREIIKVNKSLVPLIVSFATFGFEVIVKVYDQLGNLFIRFQQLQVVVMGAQIRIDEFFQSLQGRGEGADITALRDKMAALQEQIDNFWRDTDGGKIFENKIKQTAESIREAMGAANEEIEITRNALVEAAKVANEEWRAFAFNAMSAIDEFVETGRLSMKNFVRDVLQDLAKIQIRNLLFGDRNMTGGLLGGLAKGIGLNITETPGKALGGRAAASQFVGERGVELFQPDVPGTILPNTETQGLLASMKGDPVAVTMNFASGVSRQELAAEAENIEDRVVRGILSARRNGGQFGEVFA